MCFGGGSSTPKPQPTPTKQASAAPAPPGPDERQRFLEPGSDATVKLEGDETKKSTVLGTTS